MIKALTDRIVLIKDESPEKIGSIIINKKDAMYAPPYSGTVVSVGSKVNDPDLYEGCKVGFHDLAGVEFEVDGIKYLSIREVDVTSVFLEKNIKIR
jgi:co-chaperonin GroES (HSP10)